MTKKTIRKIDKIHMQEESTQLDGRLRTVDRNIGCAVGLLFGLLMSACMAWQLDRMDAVVVFMVGGALLGVILGGFLGWLHFYKRKTAESSDLATTIAVVFALIPTGLQLIANLNRVDGRGSILGVVGVAFGFMMIALFLGGALDRLYENSLRKAGPLRNE